jgi:alpha-mannosidase
MKIIILIFMLLVSLENIQAQQKKIYLAPDDHTDYMWSADEEGYQQAFLEMLDYYLNLNESTKNEPYPYQSKWNCDGSFWVYTYQKNRSEIQFRKLIEQIRDGRITVPLNILPNLQGIAPVEATLRDMYYAGSLERKYGLDLNLVINMEDQVLPLGLASLWAGAGAKYSWHGVCNCATKVKGFNSRPHEIYWYKGLDDQKILMKWYSLVENNKQLGGYAEARDPIKSISLCKDLMENSNKYPYQIAGAFGKGWDDIKTTTDEFLHVAKEFTNSEYQIIVSNEIDFFIDFESEYGYQLPSETVSYGSTEWGINVASLAEVSATIKRSIERLRVAEALFTLVALKDNKFASGLTEMREKAWIACGLYFDHDWTSDSPIITKKQRATYQRKIAGQLTDYVDTLYALSLSRLGELISKQDKDNETFFVFNPLSWKRTDYCNYQYEGSSEIKIIDKTNSHEVPFQIIILNNKKYLRILASEIPALGYKTFEIIKGKTGIKASYAAQFSDGIIESDRYKITFTPHGVITSLIDKSDNHRECIGAVNNLYANDLGSGNDFDGHPLRIENAGPVSFTLVAESDKPLRHISKITLFREIDRIELENYITMNFDAKPVVFSFSFNQTGPDIWHEESGTVINAKPVSKGGHYADSICRLDWIALNHFADMSDINHGIILSNRDAYFMKPGNSNIRFLDYITPQINILAGGQIDKDNDLGIENQDGDSYFEHFFALKPYFTEYNATASMKFALEHQNPLVSGKISGNTGGYNSDFSLFTVSDPNVLIWSIKPAEEGIENGIILRLWNLNNHDSNCTITSVYPVEKCYEVTHIEKDVAQLISESETIIAKIGHNKMQSFRIFVDASKNNKL